MKKSLLIISLFAGILANSQILGYEDIGVLLSSENKQSTARTMAMKNAFGALGGDLSALTINPAGAAVFTNSAAAFSIGNNHIDLKADFYGNSTNSSFDNFSLSQAGGLLLFENDNGVSKFKKVSVSINLNTLNNFNNEWTVSGLTSPTWIDNPADNTIEYTSVESQEYSNFSSGNHTHLNFTFATQYGKHLFLGASLNTYNVTFNEEAKREEIANDGTGNTVDAFESFWQEVSGDGYSFSTGFIVKATQNLRLGLSFTSPTWYELSEESNMFAEDEDDFVGYYDVIYSNEAEHYTNNINKVLAFNYNLRSPSKVTGSVAYVFGTKGLISADLTQKYFNNIRLRPNSEFEIENNSFQNKLTNTYQLNLGSEWRFKNISLRAGYSYEQTPYIDSIETDNKVGYALGLGYNFGSFSIDVAYDTDKKTDYYNFYPEFNTIQGAELTRNNDKILATLSFKF